MQGNNGAGEVEARPELKAEPQPVAWLSKLGKHTLDEGDMATAFPSNPDGLLSYPLYSHATVEALRSERDALRETLKPFADFANLMETEMEGLSQDDTYDLMFHDYLMERFTVRQFSQARAALASTGDQP